MLLQRIDYQIITKPFAIILSKQENRTIPCLKDLQKS